MNNYQYIIAGLPDLTQERISGDKDAGAIIAEIKEQCSERDRRTIDFLESSYVPENLIPDFYTQAAGSREGFIRKWFAFDMNVRNAKVSYLNLALGRDKNQDIMVLGDPDEVGNRPEPVNAEFPEEAELAAVLAGKNILERERGIDELYWKKADELALFHYFDLTVILSYIVKIKTIDRWMKLDEATGREMFRKLVDEIRGTFQGVKFNV